MPNTLRDHLKRIIDQHISAAVEESIAAYRGVINAGLGETGAKRRGRPPGSKSRTSASSSSSSSASSPAAPSSKAVVKVRKASAPRRARHCPVPGCEKPNKGPRFRFFCEEHRQLPRAEQDRIIASNAEARGGAAAPKASAGKRAGRPRKAGKKGARKSA